AHHDDAGEEDGAGDGEGRPRGRRRDGEVLPRQAAGVQGVAPRTRLMTTAVGTAVERLQAAARTIPTDRPESDGTLEWDSTTIVVVEAHADGRVGLGYTYTDGAAAELVTGKLAEAVCGADAFAVGAAHEAMGRSLRNVGRPGLAWCALSAVDLALWDLKARLLDLPLVRLLEGVRDEVPIYGSGGFCTYRPEEVAEQLGGWVADGIPRVKMKVGREPAADAARVASAREAIGAEAELYVDANGAYSRKQALAWAERYAGEWGVTWFEEPVSSADVGGAAAAARPRPRRGRGRGRGV